MTLLLAPMRAEATALRRGVGDALPARRREPGDARPAGHRGADGLTVLRTGTGPAAAMRAATRLSGRPMAIAGVGGGLTAGLVTGQVVVADQLLSADGPGSPVAGTAPVALPGAADTAEALRAAGLTVHLGPVVSARRPALTDRSRARLSAGGALLVDTESYFLTAITGAPVCCVRVVADTAAQAVLSPATLYRLCIALHRLRLVGAVLADHLADGPPAGRAATGPPRAPVTSRTTDRVEHTQEVR